jgi:hypothetical protein
MNKSKDNLMNNFVVVDTYNKCIYCNIIIKHKTSLKKHVDSLQHQNNKKTTFLCIDCGFTTKSEKVYNNHFLSKTHKKKTILLVKRLISYLKKKKRKS